MSKEKCANVPSWRVLASVAGAKGVYSMVLYADGRFGIALDGSILPGLFWNTQQVEDCARHLAKLAGTTAKPLRPDHGDMDWG